MDLLIHVGLHKTGTTSVQDHLYRRRECLRNEGILYPNTGLFGSQHALIPGSVIPKHFFLDRIKRSLHTEDYINELSEEVCTVNPRLVLLSSEVFSEIAHNRELCLGMINRISARFSSCRLLLTLRNPQELALSALKHSVRERIEPWLQDPLGSYKKAYNSVKSLHTFWQNAGIPLYSRWIEEDSSGNLTDHYFGEIIDIYSNSARACIADNDANRDNNDSQRLNSDRLPASTYAILFLIGNSEKSRSFAKKPIFSMISKMMATRDSYSEVKDLITTKHLLGYLEYFRSQNDEQSSSQLGLISIEEKRNALKHADIPCSAIDSLASVATRLIASG
jgi:hypothetical protein